MGSNWGNCLQKKMYWLWSNWGNRKNVLIGCDKQVIRLFTEVCWSWQVAYCLQKNVLMCLHQTEVFIVYRKCIDLLWSKQGYVLIICDQVVMDYKSKPNTLDFFRSLADVCMKRFYSDCLLTCEVIKRYVWHNCIQVILMKTGICWTFQKLTHQWWNRTDYINFVAALVCGICTLHEYFYFTTIQALFYNSEKKYCITHVDTRLPVFALLSLLQKKNLLAILLIT